RPFAILIDKSFDFKQPELLHFIIGIPIMTAAFMKDIFHGASPFKKVLGLQIVNSETLKPITPLQSVIRNSTCIILLPIELFFMVVSPQKRLGDLIIKSKIVEVTPKPFIEVKRELKTENRKIKIWQLIIVTIILVTIESIAYKLIYFGQTIW
ncbi:RDD family protein, partial [Marinilabilia salmonicolor]|uniref:RDD family protein n=1 Tax=Marinilabilia salmonicolor TaxID=989 RepID=UPI000565ED02